MFRTMNQWRFKLLYDGECPLCQREARFLQKRNRHGWLAFEDISRRILIRPPITKRARN
jgi:predicted DCC family thiol-disulfide oxidoreductase YuxK